jgi:hypothetical protein
MRVNRRDRTRYVLGRLIAEAEVTGVRSCPCLAQSDRAQSQWRDRCSSRRRLRRGLRWGPELATERRVYFTCEVSKQLLQIAVAATAGP